MPRFQECCEKGFRGAIKLAAFASGKSEKAIEVSYKKYCDEGGFQQSSEELAPDEMMDKCDPAIIGAHDPNECHEILTTLQKETVFVDPRANQDTAPDIHDHVELAFEQVPDKEDMESLFADADPQASEKPDGEYLPTTLLEAMNSPGDTFNSLWRLCLHVRCAKGGVDRRFIANHRKVRGKTKPLNWHQHLRPIAGSLVYIGIPILSLCALGILVYYVRYVYPVKSCFVKPGPVPTYM